ncbi:NAD kinase [Brevibacillus borstelensis]|jgi:NAD+ kinase|uniref:NAD kinase n=1 Tax=Brevibacillus borstelensis TaxID=45462 RepID=UPI00046AC9A5|nr:NAD kinase [Brevibacillus borstelensis]MCC0564581.1 NAD kinase [Brevibacillus borstelensis]MCM3470494.1 NAD kinase [Brevibacillus borstelensis]MCM3558048.1 NAD kinase [Brevibacillus borstelensis]MCM3592012.1 NAD kinase [Brevibacillus borstelensis]NOU53311.1 NAD kinase [Brevibacillus borstelensis]
MKIATVLRKDDYTREVCRQLREKLLQPDCPFRFVESPEEKPDMVLSIGGDGTLLEAVHQYGFEPAYVGIHTGHLGFYADWHPDELDEFVQVLTQRTEPVIVEYPTVQCRIHTKQGITYDKWALNELVIRNASLSTLVACVYINGDEFETFRGDGLIVSSPSGSTAYNKAVNGALVHPSIEAIQLSEIASINNQAYRTVNSSLVLPNHHEVELIVMNPEIMIGLDREQGVWKDVRSITCRVGGEKVKFARFKKLTFWSRVRKSFITG